MNALSIPFIIDAVEESTVARLREKLGGHGPERRSPRPSPATLPTMDSARPCHVCQAEGQHDPWCTIHLADYEDMDRPPCDCGLRVVVRRTPSLKPVVLCDGREDKCALPSA